MRARLLSSTPLPEGKRIDAVHFDTSVTQCQVSDAVPGGFGGCSVGWNPFLQNDISGLLSEPINFVDLGHFQIFQDSEIGWLIFEGRVMDMDSPTGLQVTALSGCGYGVGELAATTDNWYFSEPYDGEVTIPGDQLLREVLEASAPLLKVGDKDAFYHTGGHYLRSGENGRYPNQAIDEIVKAGDINNNQIIFAVYEDRVVQMLPKVPPVDPNTNEIIADYYVPLDKRYVSRRRSGKLMVGAVAVQFKDPTSDSAGATSVSDRLEQARFRDAHGGLLRGFLVPSSNWTQAQAEFYRDTYLQRYKNPLITCMVNSDKQFPVYNREGNAIPYYQIRSGGWLKIADDDPLLVTSTRKDLMAETCSLVSSSVI